MTTATSSRPTSSSVRRSLSGSDRAWLQELAETVPTDREARPARRHLLYSSHCGALRERRLMLSGEERTITKVCERPLCAHCSISRAELAADIAARTWSGRVVIGRVLVGETTPSAARVVRAQVQAALRAAGVPGWHLLLVPGAVVVVSRHAAALAVLRNLDRTAATFTPAQARQPLRAALSARHLHLEAFLRHRRASLRDDPWLRRVRCLSSVGDHRNTRSRPSVLAWPSQVAIRSAAWLRAWERRGRPSDVEEDALVRVELLDREGVVLHRGATPVSFGFGVRALEELRARRHLERAALRTPRPPS